MPQQTVAVVNGLADTMLMLEVALQEIGGFDTLAVQVRDVRLGIVDLPALARRHNIAGIVYDIAIPYAENWAFLQQLRGEQGANLPPIVVTTTNLHALQQCVDAEVRALEIIGKPYDLEALIAAVHRAVACNPGP